MKKEEAFSNALKMEEKEIIGRLEKSKSRKEPTVLLRDIKEHLEENNMERANDLIDEFLEAIYSVYRGGPSFEGELMGNEPIVENAPPEIEKLLDILESEDK